MIGIAVCTHSDFAQGLCNAVEMIAGPQEQLTALNFMGDIGLEEYGEQLKKAAEGFSDGCIFVTDLENATPFNAALMAIAYTDNVILSGASMPLMLELVIKRAGEGYTPESLAREVLQSHCDAVSLKTSREVFGS